MLASAAKRPAAFRPRHRQGVGIGAPASWWTAARNRALALATTLALTVGALPLPTGPTTALAAPECTTSGPSAGAYTVEVCLSAPTDGAVLMGDETVQAQVSVVGSSPGVQKVVFHLDGAYLLTDYAAPYSFVLPTALFFADGPHVLEVEAVMRDMFVTAPRSQVTAIFANGVITPPGSGNSFTEVNGPASGPVVLAAVGDGPDGGPNAMKVANLIDSWNPDMFLYLGDVYDKGTADRVLQLVPAGQRPRPLPRHHQPGDRQPRVRARWRSRLLRLLGSQHAPLLQR